MALKPWYKVITPREDLRDGRPLDASEFAVQVRGDRGTEAHAPSRSGPRGRSLGAEDSLESE